MNCERGIYMENKNHVKTTRPFIICVSLKDDIHQLYKRTLLGFQGQPLLNISLESLVNDSENLGVFEYGKKVLDIHTARFIPYAYQKFEGVFEGTPFEKSMENYRVGVLADDEALFQSPQVIYTHVDYDDLSKEATGEAFFVAGNFYIVLENLNPKSEDEELVGFTFEEATILINHLRSKIVVYGLR